jgi:hypothetical protein
MSRRKQPRNRQTAKHKLNSAHFLGSLVVAGLLGGATGSVGVFVFALVVLLAAGLHSGDIRS